MNDKPARYIVEIKNSEGKYSGKVYKNRFDTFWEIADLAIGKQATVKINNQDLPLSDVIDRMLRYRLEDRENLFKEDGQLTIGKHLFSAIFNSLPEVERKTLKREGNEIRILSDDEYAARLPWTLLADLETFLSARNTTVVLSSRTDWDKCLLPPSPKIRSSPSFPLKVSFRRPPKI